MSRKLAACFLALGCLVATARTGSAQSAALVPDLVILEAPLKKYKINRIRGRYVLRFTTAIANIGQGHMEVRGDRGSSDEPLLGYQRIYRQDGSFQDVPVGEFIFHDEHNHWHLVDVANYRLLNANQQEVASSEKVTFCLRDDLKLQPLLPGASHKKRYKNCPRGRKRLSLVTGVSIGWADVYDTSVPGQSLDINDLPAGNYTLELTVDPSNLLTEANEGNNTTRVPIVIPERRTSSRSQSGGGGGGLGGFFNRR